MFGLQQLNIIRRKFLFHRKVALRIIANASWNPHTNEYFSKYSIINNSRFYTFRLACVYRDAVVTNNEYFLSTPDRTYHTLAYNATLEEKWKRPKLHTPYGEQLNNFQLPVRLNDLSKHHITPESVSYKSLRQHFSSV